MLNSDKCISGYITWLLLFPSYKIGLAKSFLCFPCFSFQLTLPLPADFALFKSTTYQCKQGTAEAVYILIRAENLTGMY